MYQEYTDISHLSDKTYTACAFRCIDFSNHSKLLESVSDSIFFRMYHTSRKFFPQLIAQRNLLLQQPELPFSPFRPSLYSPLELLDGYDPSNPKTFATHSRDGLIYSYFKANDHLEIPRLFERIHDASLSMMVSMNCLQREIESPKPLALWVGILSKNRCQFLSNRNSRLQTCSFWILCGHRRRSWCDGSPKFGSISVLSSRR